jgi:hypothetical protein
MPMEMRLAAWLISLHMAEALGLDDAVLRQVDYRPGHRSNGFAVMLANYWDDRMAATLDAVDTQ